jgi:hypothetical protein
MEAQPAFRKDGGINSQGFVEERNLIKYWKKVSHTQLEDRKKVENFIREGVAIALLLK